MNTNDNTTEPTTPAQAKGAEAAPSAWQQSINANNERIKRWKERETEERAALEWTSRAYNGGSDDGDRDETEIGQMPMGDLIVRTLTGPTYRLDGARASDSSFELGLLRAIGREVIMLANSMQSSDCNAQLSESELSLVLHTIARRALYGAELLGRRMDALQPHVMYREDPDDQTAHDLQTAVDTIREHMTPEELGEVFAAGQHADPAYGLPRVEQYIKELREGTHAKRVRIAETGSDEMPETDEGEDDDEAAPQDASVLPVASMRKAVALLQAYLPAEPAHDRCDNVEGALSTIEAWLAEDHQATLWAK